MKYVKSFTDRHGHRRHYFRRGGKTLGPLPGAFGSDEFKTAYEAFLNNRPASASKTKPGSLGRLITSYYNSVEFSNLAPNTQRLYKFALEPLAAQYGNRPSETMDQQAVRTIIERIGGDDGKRKKGMANITRAVLRLLMQFAISKGIRKDNPVIGLPRYKGGTYHTWTEDEISQFEARWPLGTRERLAHALILFTGQRVSDVVGMTRADLARGYIDVTQDKTGTELRLPIAPEIYEAVKAGPAHVKWLYSDRRGKKATAVTLSLMIKEAVKAAGLPSICKAHGLRKSMTRRLAESGATEKEIGAVSGHKSLKEIERYTAAANQPKLARAALEKLKKRT